MIKKIASLRQTLIVLLFMLMYASISYAQRAVYSGVVKDENDLGLVGVAIQIVGTESVGTMTDLEGNFHLEHSGGKDVKLRFSYMGYKTMELLGTMNMRITMEPDAESLEEVVVVGFGTQKRVSVTGAVNSIKTSELAIASNSSIAASLQGRLPGTVIVQNSGMAGAKSADISIRGSANNPLILVDGIERSFEDLDMDEVESISVLKDASATAVYGIRGGDGVIIVTTKRGQEGKFKINFKAEGALSQRGDAPEMLDSYQYAMLRNEGGFNDSFGDPNYKPLFSEDELELYKSGKNPLLYPSSNWMDEITNEFGYRQRYNLSVSGGTKFFRTFTTVGFMQERDAYRDFDVDYDDRSMYQRYNIRSNIDVDLTKSTLLSVDLGGQFANRHRPNVDLGSLTMIGFKTPPHVDSFHDGKVIVATSDVADASPLETMYNKGYVDSHTNKLQFALKLEQKLDFITRGLKADISATYDHIFTNSYTSSHSNASYALGFFDPSNNSVVTSDLLEVRASDGWVLNPFTNEWVEQAQILQDGTDSKMGSSRSTSTSSRNINLKARLAYNRGFNGHNVGALAVYTINTSSYHGSSDSYVPLKYMEVAARASYNYDYRYFVEVNLGYNGSETFAPENRFGFFPAVSAGWVLTNEPYFPKNDVLSFLKLRGSYGTTGIDKGINRFMYFDEYDLTYTGGYMFGLTPSGIGWANQTKTGNMLVSWATNYQTNLALETKWASDRLKIDVDLFENNKRGLMMEPNSVPSIVASQLPAGNIKELSYEGYEVQASWGDKVGNVRYRVFANYSYADATNVFIDEVKPEYDWQVKTGRHPNQLEGLDCIGFYTQEDIDFLAANGGVGTPDVPTSQKASLGLQAGDLKYKDMNEDGIIDDNDVTYFEQTATPKTIFGFGGGLTWKGLGFNIFFQGAADVAYTINGRMRNPFQSGLTNGPAYIYDSYWTQERFDAGEEILYPRMSASTASDDHNHQSSNFWMRDASYIRLKNVELNYKLQTRGLKEVGIQGIGFSLSATNLCTWSKLKIVDPEAKSAESAPIPPNRVYTLGVNFSF